MPASFDDEMTIDQHDEHRCLESVGGPLGLATGETVLRLDFWVFQNKAACVGFLLGSNAGIDVKADRWTIKPDPHRDHFGEGFQPGAATAVGLMVKNAAGQVIVEQWDRDINLV